MRSEKLLQKKLEEVVKKNKLKDYSIISKGTIIKVQHDGKETIVKEDENKDINKNDGKYGIVNYVRKSLIDNYLKFPVSKTLITYKEVETCIDNRNLEVLSEVSFFDLNHSYLQVAYLNGYLTDTQYKIALKNYDEYKIEVCMALSNNYKNYTKIYFKNNKIKMEIDCSFDWMDNITSNIVNLSKSIMYFGSRLVDNFYFTQNDSICVPVSEHDKIKKYLDSHNLKYKNYVGDYLGNGVILTTDGFPKQAFFRED